MFYMENSGYSNFKLLYVFFVTSYELQIKQITHTIQKEPKLLLFLKIN